MHHVIRLRRIYRLKTADDFKLSTIRLRDYVCTPEDHAMWSSHDLNGFTPGWQASPAVLQSALNLVVENEACGTINGQKLAAMADCAARVRIEAHHNDVRAATKVADEFRSIRSLTHLCVGAPVMLTQNQLWDRQVVPLGLMNGARGIVVAILYKNLGNLGRTNSLYPQDGLMVRSDALYQTWLSCTLPTTMGSLVCRNCQELGCPFHVLTCDTSAVKVCIELVCHCVSLGL